MKRNVGKADRVIRLIIAAGIVTGYLTGMLSGTALLIAALAGVIMVATGSSGLCPLYSVCGISSAPKSIQKETNA